MEKSKKINTKLIGIIAVLVIVVAVIIGVVLTGGGSTAKLGEEQKVEAHKEIKFKNGDDKIVFYIDSDVEYKEDEEMKLNYVLMVNGDKYEGEYTFATGYSIHSEPTNIPYRVNFVGVEEGNLVTIVVKEAQQDAQ